MTSEPKMDKLSEMFFFNESTTVNAAMIAKIPIVTPVKDRIVLSGFCLKALTANLKLSKSNRIKIKSQFVYIPYQKFSQSTCYRYLCILTNSKRSLCTFPYCSTFYEDLMATTGSSLAAFKAGIIPLATPTNEDTPNPRIIFFIISDISKLPRSI